MRRRLAALAVLVLLTAGSLRADVAPFPSWRLATDGPIAAVVQAGSTLYVGGSFAKIGTAVPRTSALLDPVTLTVTPSTGCATHGGFAVYWRYTPDPSPTALADGAGPFPLPAGTDLVRVGPDCRFDRRFRVVLPPGVQIDSAVTEIVETGGRVYVHAAYYPVFLGPAAARGIVEVDGVTGALLRYWIDQTPDPLRLAGVTAAGRVVASTRNGMGQLVLGWFDPATGAFDPAQTLAVDGQVILVGSAVVVSLYVSDGYQQVALDAASLTPLPLWPTVRGSIPVVAAGAGRIFLWGSGETIDGVATRLIVAFDATTGARDTAWSPPSLTPDVGGRVSRLHVAAGRLIVAGDFSPGAPRDTMAALDAATGTLDPWVFAYDATFVQDLAGALYVPEITARDRVARAGLAAVDAATGAVLPWAAPAVPAAALAADPAGGYLYVGRSGGVDRVSLATGALDTTWGLDVTNGPGTPGPVSAMAYHAGGVYVTGLFSSVTARGSPTAQPREGIAAIATSGAVLPWRVPLAQTCVVYARLPVPTPCVSQLLVSEGRIVLRGQLASTDGTFPGRFVMAVTPDTGAVDPLVPPFTLPAGPVAADATGLYLVVMGAGAAAPFAAHLTSQAGPRLIGPLGGVTAPPGLAVRRGRLYADVERETGSGAATGNAHLWQGPVALEDGVADLGRRDLSHFAAIAGIAPRAPSNLQATFDGARLTLRWSPGAGDHVPLAAPPPPGGTAATSHTVLASLTPGGTPVAQFDTGAADTTFSITAPAGTFYVRVHAGNAFGTSPPSDELRVDVRPQPPDPPPATRATVQGRAVQIDWQAPPRGWPATSYRLEAGTARGLADIGTLPVSGLSFEAPAPPGRYYVRVRAVNASGASAPGEDVVIDVP